VDTPQGDLNSNGVLDSYPVPSRSESKSTFEGFPLSYAHGADDVTTWSEAHFYAECSNKGVCDRSTGLCECWPGYEGSGCTRTACPSASAETCSGHGTCNTIAAEADADHAYNGWDMHKTQACKCDPGYTGIDCSQRTCPSGDDPITKYVKLTTLCMEKENQPTQAIHQNNMPVHNYDTLATARTKVYGSKSSATGVLASKSGWSKIENGVTSTLADSSGCINLVDVSGEFVVGDKIMLEGEGTALKSASHTTEELIIRTITRSTYTNTAQTSEVQTLVFKPQYLQATTFNQASAGAVHRGRHSTVGPTSTKFALTFTAEDGQKYTTRTILSGMTEPATIKSLMDDIEAALEELPNGVVENVQMYMRQSYTTGSYVACPSDGEFPTGGVVTDGVGNVKFVSGFGTAGLYTAANDLNANGALTTASAICDYFALDIKFTSNTGDIPILEVYGPQTEDGNIADGEPTDVATNEFHENFYSISVLTKTVGTTENVACSNRGLCDHATGTCKCYPGFTGHDCAKQNVLAMF
jgi:hypothetical protein